MNEFLYRAALVIFLALPPALLGIRFVRPRWLPWLLVLPLVVLVTWAAVNAAVFFRFEALGDELRAAGDTPPRELMERWASDGGNRMAALFLGWLYGVAYLVPWLGVYGVARGMQRWLLARRSRRTVARASLRVPECPG
jgi:4-amino-4-deoxy-L-arabinose transferase-like glycosyltransferase